MSPSGNLVIDTGMDLLLPFKFSFSYTNFQKKTVIYLIYQESGKINSPLLFIIDSVVC